MSDKPKYQHELAERLAGLTRTLSLDLPELPEREDDDEPEELVAVLPPALLFIRAFWETMCREWRGIDRLRLNKYYYLMKQFMKAGAELIQKAEFDQDFTCLYFSVLLEFPLNVNNDKISAGLKIHFIENYVDALRELGEMFEADLTLILLSPFFEPLASANDRIILKTLRETFEAMLTKHVELETITEKHHDEQDENEDAEEGEEEVENSDVFDFGSVAGTLFQIGADPEVRSANRKVLYALSELFKPFASEDDCMDGDCCGDSGCDEEAGCCAHGDESCEEESCEDDGDESCDEEDEEDEESDA